MHCIGVMKSRERDLLRIVDECERHDTFASTIFNKFKYSQIEKPSNGPRLLGFAEDAASKAAYAVSYGSIADGATSAYVTAPRQET
jgi:hypothetical protein